MARPVSSVVAPWPPPAVRAAAVSPRARSASRAAVARNRSGSAPSTRSSSAPSTSSTTAAVSAPRAAAWFASVRRARRTVSQGTAVPASTSATSSIRPAAGSIHHTSATLAAPATSAIRNGGTTRSSRS